MHMSYIVKWWVCVGGLKAIQKRVWPKSDLEGGLA